VKGGGRSHCLEGEWGGGGGVWQQRVAVFFPAVWRCVMEGGKGVRVRRGSVYV